jgi:hypothetical protein
MSVTIRPRTVPGWFSVALVVEGLMGAAIRRAQKERGHLFSTPC